MSTTHNHIQRIKQHVRYKEITKIIISPYYDFLSDSVNIIICGYALADVHEYKNVLTETISYGGCDIIVLNNHIYRLSDSLDPITILDSSHKITNSLNYTIWPIAISSYNNLLYILSQNEVVVSKPSGELIKQFGKYILVNSANISVVEDKIFISTRLNKMFCFSLTGLPLYSWDCDYHFVIYNQKIYSLGNGGNGIMKIYNLKGEFLDSFRVESSYCEHFVILDDEIYVSSDLCIEIFDMNGKYNRHFYTDNYVNKLVTSNESLYVLSNKNIKKYDRNVV